MYPAESPFSWIWGDVTAIGLARIHTIEIGDLYMTWSSSSTFTIEFSLEMKTTSGLLLHSRRVAMPCHRRHDRRDASHIRHRLRSSPLVDTTIGALVCN